MICQWGSKAGNAANHPAVARCELGSPQPYTGLVENDQEQDGTVEMPGLCMVSKYGLENV
eukprot:scaffold649_cov347-Pavlova_lutheri.AAC.146